MASKGTAGYIEALKGEDQRHLSEVRNLRRRIWANSDIDSLDRAVLGHTGSESEL